MAEHCRLLIQIDHWDALGLGEGDLRLNPFGGFPSFQFQHDQEVGLGEQAERVASPERKIIGEVLLVIEQELIEQGANRMELALPFDGCSHLREFEDSHPHHRGIGMAIGGREESDGAGIDLVHSRV
jgi:hypothetical protein